MISLLKNPNICHSSTDSTVKYRLTSQTNVNPPTTSEIKRAFTGDSMTKY